MPLVLNFAYQDIWSFGLVLLECASQLPFWDSLSQVYLVGVSTFVDSFSTVKINEMLIFL